MKDIKNIIVCFLSLINAIGPKKNIIIFNSFPDVSDNSLALYEYIVKSRKDIFKKYKLVWTVSKGNIKKCQKILRKRTKIDEHIVVEKKSIMGFIYFFVAKYIFSTHGYFSMIETSKKQLHIDLWHGMPFKVIGADLKHANGKIDNADLTIASSKLFKPIMSHAFGIKQSQTVITGLPRNDVLLQNNNFLKKLDINEKYKKIIVWLPTYRQSVVGDIRLDGNLNSFGFSEILKNHYDKFLGILKKNNYLLIIKPHPMDMLCNEEFKQNNNIRIIKNSDLDKKCVTLYELLASCDCLWTDYSSVFIDFLITKKPIAFVCDDLEEYQKTRGFFFNPPRDYMPGELIENYNELINYLNNMDAINAKWVTKRQEICKLMNKYCDNKSCERICNHFFGNEGN